MICKLLQRLAAWIIMRTVTDEQLAHDTTEDFYDGDPNHIHVTPVDDLIEHEENNEGDCPCGPEVARECLKCFPPRVVGMSWRSEKAPSRFLGKGL